MDIKAMMRQIYIYHVLFFKGVYGGYKKCLSEGRYTIFFIQI